MSSLRELPLECSSEVPFGCIGVVGFVSFSHFCKFSFVGKIIFQFFARGRRHYTKPRKLLCPIFFAFVYYHIYISLEVAVLVIAQPTLPQHKFHKFSRNVWALFFFIFIPSSILRSILNLILESHE